MSTPLFLVLFGLFATLVNCLPTAVCILEPVGTGDSKGTVLFEDLQTGLVRVTANLTGVPDGGHALHVHTFGDISEKEDGSLVGGHYVGLGSETHGCPPNSRHQGDLGNWISENGEINEVKEMDLVTLFDGFSIVGRGCVLHELEDQCDSDEFGRKLAQGTIGIANVEENVASGSLITLTSAVASLSPTSNCDDGCRGTVWFQKISELEVVVTARIEGLVNGSVHAIHVHEFGDLTDETGLSTGGHYNPDGAVHRLPPEQPRHAGDMGNVQSYDEEGVAWYQYTNNHLIPFDSLLGRSVVVHSDADHGDGEGCSNGGAGSRLMSGVIGISPELGAPVVPIEVDTNWTSEDCVAAPERVQVDINFFFGGMIPQPNDCPCGK